MITLSVFIFTMLLFFIYDKQSFAFAFIKKSDPVFKKFNFSLKDIKASILLKVVPIVAAAGAKVVGGVAGGAAAGGGGGIMGMLGKLGGKGMLSKGLGMMGGGGGKGGGGGQGGGGGGMMSGLINGATKPMRTTMGLATAAVQGIQAARLKRKAEAAFPELVDPNQAAYLSDLNQKRKSIETGADFSEAFRAANASQANANNSIISSGGGDAGGTMQALLQAQRVSSDAKNQALAQGQSQQQSYDNAYGDQLNLISARKMQLQLMRSQQARAEWDRKSKLASANLQAGMAGLVPGGNSNPQPGAQFGGGDTPMGGGGGNGLDPAEMIKMIPKANTGLGNVPSAPSASPIPAPTVTPQFPNGAGMAKGVGPAINLLKK